MAINYEKLIREIIVPLVVNVDDVVVHILSDEPDMIHLQVLVSEADLGRVIGKGGRLASAIRTIVYAGASKEGRKVNLEFDAL